MEYNAHISSHFHISPFFALPTTPSETLLPAGMTNLINNLLKVERQLVSFKTNLATLKINYLSKWGKRYINSRYNKTN